MILQDNPIWSPPCRAKPKNVNPGAKLGGLLQMSLNITLTVTGFFSRASTPERRPHSQPSEFLGDVFFPAFGAKCWWNLMKKRLPRVAVDTKWSHKVTQCCQRKTGAGFGSSNGCFQIWIEATLRGQRPRFGRMKTWAGSISPKSTGQTVQEKGTVILPYCLTNLSRIHQEFQVPKMEVLNLISYFRLFWGLILRYINLTHSLYRWGFLQF